MFVYIAGRRQGKTTACIRWLLENPGRRVLLVANQSRRQHVMDELRMYVRELRFSGQLATRAFWERCILVPSPIRGYDFTQLSYAREIAVDDLEEVLDTIFRTRVDLITANGTAIYGHGSEPPRRDYVDGESWEWEDDRKAIERRRSIGDGRNAAGTPRIT